MALLPDPEDEAHYELLWSQEAPWQRAVQTLAARHGLAGTPERYRSGTAVVYRLGEAVLKLYGPLAAGDSDVEVEVLARLTRAGTVPAPRLLARGREGEWTYVVMSRLAGVPIDDVWAQRSAIERVALAYAAGQVAHALHAVPCAGLPRLDDDWATFRASCRERALRRNLERGLPAERAAELERVLAELDAEPEVEDAHVLLHTELGPGHLLVDGAQLSGLFDFAEARAGLPEYDLAAAGLFVTRGDQAAFRALLDGYGLPAARRGPALVRRLFRHALLHQYGHLRFYLERSPVPEPSDLWAAAEHWFAH
jgi:hygromycin-B 7''-O-kinase